MRFACKAVLVSTVLCMAVSSARADFTFPVGSSEHYNPVAGVTLGWNGVWNGGPFDVHVNWGSLPQGKDFSTFCVESTIEFYPGAQYVATVDKVAAQGGLSGNYNPLNAATAWIYKQYLGGSLRSYSSAAISQAIWYEMGQSGGSHNTIAESAEAATYSTAANPDTVNIGNVRILNLWLLDSAGKVTADAQSQLTVVPVPAAIVLGALGLGLVGWTRRRMA